MPRNTLPIRVHQLWDCIEHAATGSVLDLDKMISIASALHNISKDELITDLKSAVDDGLIKCEEVKNKTGTSNVYALPDPEFTSKGDHDWYCFKCHVGGDMVSCEDCPRVFHMDCLDDDRKPQQDLFVCPQCHIKSTKPAAEKVNLKQKQLNVLLTYICDRIKDWQVPTLDKFDGKVWATATNRAVKEHWRLDYLVYTSIDMTVIGDKAVAGKYTSLEEFQVDCETLFHAVGCYFGSDLIKGNGIGASFMRDVMHDINEILLCHDCFRRSNEKDHPWWFCLPCHKPHDVVWAKQTGYPFWPAKVMRKEGNKYDVRYFGGSYDRGHVDGKNILPIDTSLATLKVRKTASWTEAYDELQQYLAIQKDPNLIDSLPAKHGKSSVPAKPKAAGRASLGKEKDDLPPPKRRKVEAAPKADTKPTPKGRPSITPRAPITPKASTKATPSQNNGISTLKKNVATPKSAETMAGAAADAQAVLDLGYRGKAPTGMADLFAEFELELRQANNVDGSEGKPARSEESPSPATEKATENVVSSTEPCIDSVPGDDAKKVEFGDNVNAVLEKYKEKMNDRYVSDVSATKRKQWCFNCEREAIYHCCWNTAYCSTGCQQYHWTKEHKRLCRRKKASSDNNP